MKKIQKLYYTAGVSMTLGMLSSSSAFAAKTVTGSTVATNVVTSIASLPGLVSALSYLAGTVFGVLGVLKIKEHVENPQTPLKEGAIKLGTAGALFTLPFMFNVFADTISAGDTSATPAQASLGSLAMVP